MVVGEMAEPVDLLVIGAGPGGYVAAVRAAELGRNVVVIDRSGVEGGLGGACLHVGCIPSKALIELASGLHQTRELQRAGLTFTGATVDLAVFQTWKQAMVHDIAGKVKGLLKKHGVQVIVGDFQFTGPGRAAVALESGGVQFLEFRQAILATGSRPATVPGLPVDGQRVLTSTDVLALKEIPASLVVVGAGYIGLELGTALAKLGSKVTVVETADRILPGIDKTLSGPVQRRLEHLGVNALLGTTVVGFDGTTIEVEGPRGREKLGTDAVLVAVGRLPNTNDIGLREAGVPVDDRGFIPVDAKCLATPRIAAIGDVTHGAALAHRASAQAIVAAEALCGLPTAFDPMAIPLVIFTDPEIASVGLTESEAQAAGLDACQFTSPWSANGRAATLGDVQGFTRVVIDRANSRVVGVHIVGPHASELVAEGALAIEMIASPEDVLGTIHPHPTLSEGFYTALEQYRSQT